MPASRFLKIVQETGQNSSAVSTCQFLLPGTTLYNRTHTHMETHTHTHINVPEYMFTHSASPNRLSWPRSINHAHTFTLLNTSIHTHSRTHTHTRTHTYTGLHVHEHVYWITYTELCVYENVHVFYSCRVCRSCSKVAKYYDRLVARMRWSILDTKFFFRLHVP